MKTFFVIIVSGLVALSAQAQKPLQPIDGYKDGRTIGDVKAFLMGNSQKQQAVREDVLLLTGEQDIEDLIARSVVRTIDLPAGYPNKGWDPGDNKLKPVAKPSPAWKGPVLVYTDPVNGAEIVVVKMACINPSGYQLKSPRRTPPPAPAPTPMPAPVTATAAITVQQQQPVPGITVTDLIALMRAMQPVAVVAPTPAPSPAPAPIGPVTQEYNGYQPFFDPRSIQPEKHGWSKKKKFFVWGGTALGAAALAYGIYRWQDDDGPTGFVRPVPGGGPKGAPFTSVPNGNPNGSGFTQIPGSNGYSGGGGTYSGGGGPSCARFCN
jgi:hypothetical protein